MSFVLMTDSNSEIPYTMMDKYDIKVMLMPYTLDGKEYAYDLGRNTDIKAFYDRMREGANAITAQRNPQEFVEFFTPFMEEGKDVLYIAFSSQLSGTFNCAMMAREEVLAKYPDRRIEMVDTLAISMCEGQLVYHAAKMREAGATLDEVKNWVEENKMRAAAYFTVADLNYLKRGGRVSNASAVIGTMLDIKPILHISPGGKLVVVEKVKGRKKALKYLFSMLEEKQADESLLVTIMHADCMEDAETLKAMVTEKYNFAELIIHNVGPVIGSHTGPGTLGITFMGGSR